MSRYARIAEMRSEFHTPGSNKHPHWCGVCLRQVVDETWLQHDCDGRPELTDSERMTLTDFRLHKGWTIEIEIDGQIMIVAPYRIDRRSGKVWASRWEIGHYGDKHEFVVAKGQPLKVRSREGVELFPGITEAEINAMDVAHRLRNSGRKVRIHVSTQYCGIYVHLYISGEDMWGSSYSFGWSTTRPECGRSTTRQSRGWENRSLRDSNRQKFSRRLTGKQFYAEVQYIVERTARRAAQEG